MLAPIPLYPPLQSWMRVHLLKGMQSEDPLPALQTARRWSALLFSNESMIAAMEDRERKATGISALQADLAALANVD